MLIAPHPDDEALACSVVLQQARRMNVPTSVVYITDGDNNPWPQRVWERKWRLDKTDRQRWGRLRRSEACAALRALGLDDAVAVFLGLPDQGMTDLLLRNPASILARIDRVVRAWNPTDILAPSLFDIHPDHSAVGVILRLVLERAAAAGVVIDQWSYLVHGKSPAFSESAVSLVQSEKEAANKVRAILCHQTQTRLSRRRFLAYAARPERLGGNGQEGQAVNGPICSIRRQGPMIHVTLRLKLKPWFATDDQLLLIGRNRRGDLSSCRLAIPARSTHVEMMDVNSGECFARARYTGNAFAGAMMIPTDSFSSLDNLFVKLARSSWFFDAAGWMEVPAVADRPGRSKLEWARDTAAVAVR